MEYFKTVPLAYTKIQIVRHGNIYTASSYNKTTYHTTNKIMEYI